MACTTILVGKNASYDGSTMIARNDDSGSGHFTAEKVRRSSTRRSMPAVYQSVHLPRGDPAARQGPAVLPPCPTPWRARASGRLRGVNAANVGMTRHRDHHLQPPRAGRRPAGGLPARQRRPAGSPRRHRRGGHCLPCPALHPLRPRGRAAPGQPAGDSTAPTR